MSEISFAEIFLSRLHEKPEFKKEDIREALEEVES